MIWDIAGGIFYGFLFIVAFCWLMARIGTACRWLRRPGTGRDIFATVTLSGIAGTAAILMFLERINR